MNKCDIDKILEKYFLGKLSRVEERELVIWFNETDKHKQYFKEKISELESQFSMLHSEKCKELFQRIQLKSKKRKYFTQLSIAATIALIFSISWFTFSDHKVSEPILFVVNVPIGEIDTLLLPDKSKVILNSCSSLKYNSDFGKTNRDVELVGEGLFDVTKDSEMRFTVKSGDMKATVYGTLFNFNSYPNEIAVTLCSGSLEVEKHGNDNESFLMEPGDQVYYDIAKGKTHKQKVNTDLYSNWIFGSLAFKSTPLSLIASELERKFDIKIKLKSLELAEILFSGEFPSTVSLDYILDIIKQSSPISLKIEKQNKTIQISALG